MDEEDVARGDKWASFHLPSRLSSSSGVSCMRWKVRNISVARLKASGTLSQAWKRLKIGTSVKSGEVKLL